MIRYKKLILFIVISGALSTVPYWFQSPPEALVTIEAKAPTHASAAIKISATKKEVQSQVDSRNKANTKERQAFLQEGWRFVSTSEPDQDLVALDPAALPQKESQIFEQLQTNSYAGHILENVAHIARSQVQDRTRYAAIDALGRSTDKAAQTLLIDLYSQIPQEDFRDQIQALVHPEQRGDPSFQFHLQRILDDSSSPSARRQSGFSLSILYLRQNWDIADLLERLPDVRKDEVRDVYLYASSGPLAHKH